MDEKRNNDGGSCLIIILGVILFLFLWAYVFSTPAYTTVFADGICEHILSAGIG
jgi:hypothetical protein